MNAERREYPQLRARARHLLERRAGVDVTAERLAGVVADALEQLCGRFATLVGDSGISAVLDRSGKERAIDLGAVRRWPDQVAQLRDRLAAQPAVEARTMGIALLSTFVGMVCTFIGEPLTLRLLRDLWPETFEGTEEPT